MRNFDIGLSATQIPEAVSFTFLFLKGYVLSYSFQKTATLDLFGGGVHFLSCLLPKDGPPVSPTVVPYYPTHQTTKSQ